MQQRPGDLWLDFPFFVILRANHHPSLRLLLIRLVHLVTP